jgi:membrane-associated phospholipid phosphatase
MFAAAAGAAPEADAWPWVGLAVATGVLAPSGYLLWLYRRGLVSDLDVQRREERWRPLLFTLTALTLTVAALELGGAPALPGALVAANLLLTALVFPITLRWKISMHGAASGAAAALGLFLLGPPAAAGLLAVILVTWSRVHLRRHTPAQALAGAMLGAVVTWSMLLWVSSLWAR